MRGGPRGGQTHSRDDFIANCNQEDSTISRPHYVHTKLHDVFAALGVSGSVPIGIATLDEHPP